MKYRTILLFGAPGAGKGTQGKILGAVPSFFHCACGDVFRNLKPDDSIGRSFLEYSSRGQLVPDEPTVELWKQSINQAIQAGRFHPENDVLILDGIPRCLNQAYLLKDILDVRVVFYLGCADTKTLVHRMQRRALREKRLDDANLEVIKQRLATCELDAKPLLEFYGDGVVQQIDASRPPADVLYQILQRVQKVNWG